MKLVRRLTMSATAAALAVALAAGSAFAAGKAESTAKVNINTASAAELTTLPGVGPKLAARIVEYRQKQGGFKSPQELLNVKGIGEQSFAKLQPRLSLGEKP